MKICTSVTSILKSGDANKGIYTQEQTQETKQVGVSKMIDSVLGGGWTSYNILLEI